MKQIEWKRGGNHMKINTGHATFDRQTQVISTGNIIADTIIGKHIRAYSEATNPMGRPCELGEMQRFDLDGWNSILHRYRIFDKVKAFLVDRSGILYVLFHRSSNGNEIHHGFILTTDDHVLLEKWVRGPTGKSWNVVAECEKYLTRTPNPEGDKRLATLSSMRSYLWKQAAKHDGIDPTSLFVCHSEDNPFKKFYDLVTKDYLDVHDRLKYDKPLDEQCPHTRPYSWQAYDGEWVVCCCDCGAVLKGGATL